MKVSLHSTVNSSNQLNVDLSFLWRAVSQRTATSCPLSLSPPIFAVSMIISLRGLPLLLLFLRSFCTVNLQTFFGLVIKKPARKSFRVLAGIGYKPWRLSATWLLIYYNTTRQIKPGNKKIGHNASLRSLPVFPFLVLLMFVTLLLYSMASFFWNG